MKPATMWFIGGLWATDDPFLYYGGHAYRKDAIRCHETAKGKMWAQCRRDGDFAVRCEVTPLPKDSSHG